MNIGSTLGTAILRGLYLAIGTGLLSGLITYSTTDDAKAAIITGLITALGALGFRGGGEGMYDASRQKAGDVKASDVQP